MQRGLFAGLSLCKLYSEGFWSVSRLPCVSPAPLWRRTALGSSYTGEPRNAPQSLGANPAQGKQEMQCKRYNWSPIQPLSHGVFILNRRASSPYTGEPRTHHKPSVRALHEEEVVYTDKALRLCRPRQSKSQKIHTFLLK